MTYLLGEEPHLLLEGEFGAIRSLGVAQLLLLLLLQAPLPRIPSQTTTISYKDDITFYRILSSSEQHFDKNHTKLNYTTSICQSCACIMHDSR